MSNSRYHGLMLIGMLMAAHDGCLRIRQRFLGPTFVAVATLAIVLSCTGCNGFPFSRMRRDE